MSDISEVISSIKGIISGVLSSFKKSLTDGTITVGNSKKLDSKDFDEIKSLIKQEVVKEINCKFSTIKNDIQKIDDMKVNDTNMLTSELLISLTKSKKKLEVYDNFFRSFECK